MFNFRDLGGQTTEHGVVRRGILFRSSAVVALEPEEQDRLVELGIRTAIDLREPGERDAEPAHLPSSITLRLHPVIDMATSGRPPEELTEFNMWLLDSRGAELTAVVSDLIHGDGPAVFFCSSGKDRTGAISALVLGALGVSADDIVRDYTRTEELIPPDYLAQWVERGRAAGMAEGSPPAMLAAPAAVMRAFLGHLDEIYCGAADYLLKHGMQESDLARLRSLLLEQRPVEA